jgi:hypothetical protein
MEKAFIHFYVKEKIPEEDLLDTFHRACRTATFQENSDAFDRQLIWYKRSCEPLVWPDYESFVRALRREWAKKVEVAQAA